MAKEPVSKIGGVDAPCGFESHRLRQCDSIVERWLSLFIGRTFALHWRGCEQVAPAMEGGRIF